MLFYIQYLPQLILIDSKLILTAIDINKMFTEGFSLAVVTIPNKLHGMNHLSFGLYFSYSKVANLKQ